jgi:hypothetical protein
LVGAKFTECAVVVTHTANTDTGIRDADTTVAIVVGQTLHAGAGGGGADLPIRAHETFARIRRAAKRLTNAHPVAFEGARRAFAAPAFDADCPTRAVFAGPALDARIGSGVTDLAASAVIVDRALSACVGYGVTDFTA